MTLLLLPVSSTAVTLPEATEASSSMAVLLLRVSAVLLLVPTVSVVLSQSQCGQLRVAKGTKVGNERGRDERT